MEAPVRKEHRTEDSEAGESLAELKVGGGVLNIMCKGHGSCGKGRGSQVVQGFASHRQECGYFSIGHGKSLKSRK